MKIRGGGAVQDTRSISRDAPEEELTGVSVTEAVEQDMRPSDRERGTCKLSRDIVVGGLSAGS